MSAISNYLENKLIDTTLRGVGYTSPAAVYLGLFVSNPGEAGDGTEVTGGSYIRKRITFGLPTDGAASNDAEIMFPVASANWGTITHVAIYDAESTGNLLFYGTLTNTKTIQTNDQLKINAGDITVALA